MVLPPLTALRKFDTHRLLPAKYSVRMDSVLTRLMREDSPEDDLACIFALDDATNARLLAENGQSLGISARELVTRVPQAHIVNAAFTHPNPLGARFSSPVRGAWYASFELATSKAEVLFHKSIEYAEIAWTEREEILYDDYLADFSGAFHDLRPEALQRWLAPTEEVDAAQRALARQFEDENIAVSAAHPPAADSSVFAECLSPESYLASQALASVLLEAGSLGLIYPSVRRGGGTCIACFRPSVVSNVRKGERYRLTWTPTRATFVRG